MDCICVVSWLDYDLQIFVDLIHRTSYRALQAECLAFRHVLLLISCFLDYDEILSIIEKESKSTRAISHYLICLPIFFTDNYHFIRVKRRLSNYVIRYWIYVYLYWYFWLNLCPYVQFINFYWHELMVWFLFQSAC